MLVNVPILELICQGRQCLAMSGISHYEPRPKRIHERFEETQSLHPVLVGSQFC
jgi:hypothetical protein